ncbi:hypothetical protein SDC9_125229 [bioreactor metagenome]|uniref:Uncharacterized protein n=1 Tax=bioreactor metagenome TaxID=1076179 RepID=A0A645CMT3_9ZZZZ
MIAIQLRPLRSKRHAEFPVSRSITGLAGQGRRKRIATGVDRKLNGVTAPEPRPGTFADSHIVAYVDLKIKIFPVIVHADFRRQVVGTGPQMVGQRIDRIKCFLPGQPYAVPGCLAGYRNGLQRFLERISMVCGMNRNRSFRPGAVDSGQHGQL